MKPWLALIIGIAIGWLIGWLFDKWRRGRITAAIQATPAPVETRPVEIELPRSLAVRPFRYGHRAFPGSADHSDRTTA